MVASFTWIGNIGRVSEIEREENPRLGESERERGSGRSIAFEEVSDLWKACEGKAGRSGRR